MKQVDMSSYRYKGLLFWGGIFLLVIYGNALQGEFVFDDWHNIVNRPALQLTRLTPESITRTFFLADGEGRNLYRPISAFSFALNYYFGGYQVSGYHLVNIIIHLLTAYFLFKTVILLINLSGARFSRQEIVFVSGLATILWAAHPIQIQAVTFIVQRMASLAALFYILGLWSYTHFRLLQPVTGVKKNVKWLAVSMAFFFCGILSKENAIMFPFGLCLLELFFFDGFQRLRSRPVVTVGLFLVLVLALFMTGFMLFDGSRLDGLLSTYDIRPFTLKQRILSEPRVMFLYLSLLLYPVPSRFSVEHFMPLSQTLFSPSSTVLALAGIFLLLIFGVVLGRRYPLIGFPLVFYFIHHLVESSILPLALIYEHRNYLPSLFFFLPLAVVLVYGFRLYAKQSFLVWSALFLFTVAIIFLLGFSTHLRNQDWRSDETLWLSALRVAPETVRPYMGLGAYYSRQEPRDPDRALAFYSQGVNQRETYLIFEKAVLWGKMAEIYEDKRQWKRAETALENSLRIYQEGVSNHPDLIDHYKARENLAAIYSGLAHLASAFDPLKALSYIDLARGFQDRVEYDIDKALYQNQAEDYQGGLMTLRRALKKDPDGWEICFALGHMLTSKGEFDRGYGLYRRALNLARRKTTADRYRSILLYMAENRRLADQSSRCRMYVQAYLKSASATEIRALVLKHTTICPGRYAFINTGVMLEQVQDGLCRMAVNMIENQSEPVL